MNKLLATLIAGAFVATSTIALAQTSAPATTTTTPPAASTGSMKADSMHQDNMKKPTKKRSKRAKKKAAIAKEDQMIKGATHSSNSAVKAAPATGGAAMNGSMKADTKGK